MAPGGCWMDDLQRPARESGALSFSSAWNAWVPTMTNSVVPVMPAAARMMCSSCALVIANGPLDLPDFASGQHAREGRVLPHALGFIRRRDEHGANVIDRALEHALPLVVAAKEARRIGVAFAPAPEVVLRVCHPLGVREQAGRDSAAISMLTRSWYSWVTP
jgi:hypothetical protein